MNCGEVGFWMTCGRIVRPALCHELNVHYQSVVHCAFHHRRKPGDENSVLSEDVLWAEGVGEERRRYRCFGLRERLDVPVVMICPSSSRCGCHLVYSH